MAGWLATARKQKAAEVERVFLRELDAAPADEREPLRAALVMVCSWSAWDSWRTHQRLERRRAPVRRSSRRWPRYCASADSSSGIAWSAFSKRTAVMPNCPAASQLMLEVVHEQAVRGAQAVPEPLDGQLVDGRLGLAHPDEGGVDDQLEDLVQLGQLGPPERLPFAHVVGQQRRAQPAPALLARTNSIIGALGSSRSK